MDDMERLMKRVIASLEAVHTVPLTVTQRMYLIARVRADQTGDPQEKETLVQVLKAGLPHE